jgi:hypothetical protein
VLYPENHSEMNLVFVQGTSWEHVASDHTLASISCGADKQVWAVGRNGSAYWRFGITPSNPIGKYSHNSSTHFIVTHLPNL